MITTGTYTTAQQKTVLKVGQNFYLQFILYITQPPMHSTAKSFKIGLVELEIQHGGFQVFIKKFALQKICTEGRAKFLSPVYITQPTIPRPDKPETVR